MRRSSRRWRLSIQTQGIFLGEYYLPNIENILLSQVPLLKTSNNVNVTFWTSFCNSRMVLYKIFEKLSDLDKNRDSVTKQMRFLSETNPEKFLNSAIDCHLRVSTVASKYKTKCKLCQVHDQIEVYENTLFHFVKGEIKASIKDSLDIHEIQLS